MDKTSLRAETVSFRKSMNHDKKAEKDNLIFEKLVSLTEYRNAETVLVYVSGDIEVDTQRVILDSFSAGKTVAVPRCVGDSNKMDFYVIESFDDLEVGCYGIKEPKKHCIRVKTCEKTFCVVPALCVDKNGYRLGFGKGYYDRYLSENKVYSVCICYSDNVYDSIPKNEYDKAVDLVITD